MGLHVQLCFNYAIRLTCAHSLILKCSYFRTEDSNDNVLSIPVGNATLDTEFLYEYGTRAAKLKAKEEPKTGQ